MTGTDVPAAAQEAVPPQAITAAAWEAARNAAQPYAADIAAEIVTSLRMAGLGHAAEVMIAKIIGAGLAKAVAGAIEAAAPHLAAAERERCAQLAERHGVDVILPGGPFGSGIKTPFADLLRQGGEGGGA